MLKYLRIAVTALCLTACVLLVALWVRSFWRWDTLHTRMPSGRGITVGSVIGRLYCDVFFISPKTTVTMELDSLRNDDFINDYWLSRVEIPGPIGFDFSSVEDGREVVIPHWFLGALFAALVTAPWIPFRFSLRTLLIATTLVAVGMGMIVLAV